MQIDLERVRGILAGRHSYYGSRAVPIRQDTRLYPYYSDLFERLLKPSMHVLDVGCGNGGALLELAATGSSLVGIDNDPEHIRLAEAARCEQGVENIRFLLADFPSCTVQFEPESFDLVFSLRGPLVNSSETLRLGLELLKPGGLVFVQEIGEGHQREACSLFPERCHPPVGSVSQRLSSMLENAGVDVRLVQDVYTKWIYPDVYAWLEFQCNIWSWLGVPLPAADDPRIAQFGERFRTDIGEIEITHHVAEVAGMKKT
jgi:SAM-dependent methyltransferase